MCLTRRAVSGFVVIVALVVLEVTATGTKFAQLATADTKCVPIAHRGEEVKHLSSNLACTRR